MKKRKTKNAGMLTILALPVITLGSPTIVNAAAPVAPDISETVSVGDRASISMTDFVTDADDDLKRNTFDLNPSTPDDKDRDIDTPEGSWSVGSTGKLTFEHADGFIGTATIQYIVLDDEDNFSNVGTVSVTVSAGIPPVANDASTQSIDDDVAEIELSEYVTDADGDIRMGDIDLDLGTDGIQEDFETTDGDWTVNSLGKLRFRPNDGFSGLSTIQYTVADDLGNMSNAANASVTVTSSEPEAPPATAAPVAIDTSTSIAGGDQATIELSEFVTDADDDIKFTTVDLDPATAGEQNSLDTAQGSWSVGTSGRLRFTPVEGFAGVAGIFYTVSDREDNLSNAANVTVTVINPAPVATDTSTTIAGGDRAIIELSELVSDQDANIKLSTFDLDVAASEEQEKVDTPDGEWSVGSSGRLVFTPVDGFAGVATISYVVSDDEGNVSNIANVSVTVSNPAPVAMDTSTAIAADDRAIIELSEFVSDADDNIKLSSFDLDPSESGEQGSLDTEQGRWSVGSAGRLLFTPTDDFSGVATLEYTVSDDQGNTSNAASVSVTVTAPTVDAESEEPDNGEANADGADTTENNTAQQPEEYQPEKNQSVAEAPEETGTDTEGEGEQTTSPAPDTDNDGLSDAIEGNDDADGDGKPNSNDDDSDGDGIPDAVEAAANGEIPADGDGDGIFDFLDVDSDNDGISDAVESAGDLDADGVADFRDLDVDNDGILDIIEARVGIDEVIHLDTDLNGAIDLTFTTGPNGMADVVESGPESGTENYTLSNIDNDGVADYRDHDSDNDGMLDTLESNHTDHDLDGTVDDTATTLVRRTVAAVGTTGLADSAGGIPRNTDADGLADFRDGDSDNDGITDVVESFGNSFDINGDGRLDDFADTDGNGVDDSSEASPTRPLDTNDNGAFDAVEIDSDSDGITDLIEAGGIDADNDGLVDGFLDDDADGIDDGMNTLPLTPVDTDNDDTPDFQDTDSDNDGLSDLIETGGIDADGDGAADSLVNVLADNDKDGTPDYLQDATDPTTTNIPQESADILTGLNGGAGCSISGGSGSTDPLLPGMLTLSLLWIARRYRQMRG